MTKILQFLSRSGFALGPQGDGLGATPPVSEEFWGPRQGVAGQSLDVSRSAFSLDFISHKNPQWRFISSSVHFNFVPVFARDGAMASVEDFSSELRRLRDEVRRLPVGELSRAAERLAQMEVLWGEIEGLASLPISERLKASVGSFLSTGFLRGDEELLRGGLARCEQLRAYLDLRRMRDVVQKVLGMVYPVDQRVGRKEPAQREEVLFLRAADRLSDEEQAWVEELLLDAAVVVEPENYFQLLREMERLTSLYDEDSLKRLFGTYGHEVNREKALETNSLSGEDLRKSVERLESLEEDRAALGVVEQLQQEEISESNRASFLEYRDFILESAEAIETQLSLDLSQLELEEWKAEPEEGVEIEEANNIFEPEQSENLKSLRENLLAFRDLVKHLENLDLSEKEPLADLLGLMDEYLVYEREWVRGEWMRRGEWGLSLGGGHSAASELNLLLGSVRPGTQLKMAHYEALESSLQRVALWNGVIGRVRLYEQALQSAKQSDFVIHWGSRLGRALLSPALSSPGEATSIAGAEAYREMLGEYLKVSRLLLEGREAEARRQFVMLEASRNHAGLLESYEDSETFKLCTLNAGIVLLSAGMGEIVALLGARGLGMGMGMARGHLGWVKQMGAVEYGDAFAQVVGTGSFWGNAFGFTLSERKLSGYFEGGARQDLFVEDMLLNAGMFKFLGKSQGLWNSLKERGLLEASKIQALGWGARGEAVWNGESIARVSQARRVLGEQLWIQGADHALGYGVKLGGFGAWASVEGMYQEVKSGRMRLLSAARDALWSGEAWQERALFLLSLELGGLLVRPLTRDLNGAVENLLGEGYREELELLSLRVEASRLALEDFLQSRNGVNGAEFRDLLERFREALNLRLEIESALLGRGMQVHPELTELSLRELEAFEKEWEIHCSIFGTENIYGLHRSGAHWTYDPVQRDLLVEALEKHPSLIELRQFDNGLIELSFNNSEALKTSGKGGTGPVLLRLIPQVASTSSDPVASPAKLLSEELAGSVEHPSTRESDKPQANLSENSPQVAAESSEAASPLSNADLALVPQGGLLTRLARGVVDFLKVPQDGRMGEPLIAQQLGALLDPELSLAESSGRFLSATPVGAAILAPIRGLVYIAAQCVELVRELRDHAQQRQDYGVWLLEDGKSLVKQVGTWLTEAESHFGNRLTSYRDASSEGLSVNAVELKQKLREGESLAFEEWHQFFSQTLVQLCSEIPPGDSRLATVAQFLVELSKGKFSEDTEWEMRRLLVAKNVSPELFFYGLFESTSLVGAQYSMGGIHYDQTPRRLAVTAALLYMRTYEIWPKDEDFFMGALTVMRQKPVVDAVWQNRDFQREAREFFEKLAQEDLSPQARALFENVAAQLALFGLIYGVN